MGLAGGAKSLRWSERKDQVQKHWELRLARGAQAVETASGPVSSLALSSPQLPPRGAAGIEHFPAFYLVFRPHSLLRTSLLAPSCPLYPG